MKKWMYLIVVVLLASCSDINKVPREYIQPQNMKNVLWDMMLADRYVEQHLKNDTSLNVTDERFKLYAQVFYSNEITYDEFKESMHYYLSRPDQLKKVFEGIRSDREQIMQLQLEKAREMEEEQLREQDSLMKMAKKQIVSTIY